MKECHVWNHNKQEKYWITILSSLAKCLNLPMVLHIFCWWIFLNHLLWKRSWVATSASKNDVRYFHQQQLMLSLDFPVLDKFLYRQELSLNFENSILKRGINVTYITSKTTLKLSTLFVHERQLTLFTPGYFCLIMPRRHTVDSKFWKFWKKRMTSWIHLLIAVAYTKTNLLNY